MLMHMTRAELQSILEELDRMVPHLRWRHPFEGAFWEAFAAIADRGTDNVSAEDDPWWWARLTALMDRHGLQREPA